MSQDLEIIKELEKEIGKELKKILFADTVFSKNSFSMDDVGTVTGLNLYNLNLRCIPGLFSKLQNLRGLRL